MHIIYALKIKIEFTTLIFFHFLLKLSYVFLFQYQKVHKKYITCNRTTGNCDTGCNFGYHGELCKTCLIDADWIILISWLIDFSNLKI